METIIKNNIKTRHQLFAVAVFFGVSALTNQAAASQTEIIYSNGLPAVKMEFFNSGELSSEYNFNKPLVNVAKSSVSYWKNILNMRENVSPWQIAFATSSKHLVTGQTFSFHNGELTQENFLAQMIQNNRVLEEFDLKKLANEKISADYISTILQENAPLNADAALTFVQIGSNVGANRNGSIRGWVFKDKIILPTNEQAADLAAALRQEIANSLIDESAWKSHVIDASDSDKKFFIGKNVSEVLGGKAFDGVRGIPLDGSKFLVPGLMSSLPYKNYTTFTELELAAMQDLGYNFDRKKFFGKSIYTDGTTEINSDEFKTSEPLAIGLHVWGTNNNVTQSGNILLMGDGSAGIRVDGLGNKISVPQGTEINSIDKGILISYGRNQNLDIAGNVSAKNAVEFNFGSNILGASGEYRGSYIRYLRGIDSSGNIIIAQNLPLNMPDGIYNYSADELNGALVDEFNLTGTLSGENAIYIGKNSFVKDININSGAQLFGNINSDWKHFTQADGFTSGGSISPIRIQYGGKYLDASKYIPDLTTNLNFNTSLNYDGNITGSDNIKMHVNTGTLNFSGSADVVSVDVMRGAQLFGGNFTLHDMSADLAEGFIDSTGTFINHGTIGALSNDTNLVINGNLISDGFIKKISGGSAGSIIVNGSANIEGSTVITDTLLPNETSTVLTANSITGNIANPATNPFRLSAMLDAYGTINGNTLTVTTVDANNLPKLDSSEKETFDAMKNMFDKLDDHENEKREFYNLDPPEAKKAFSQIGSSDSAQIMSVAQQSTAADKLISERLAKVLAPDYFDVNVHPINFADGDEETPAVKVKVKNPSRQENNFWLNYMKNWGSLRGGTDYHGSVIVAGYDRPVGKKWRAGIFATYGTIGYGAESSRATVYDTRVGLYAGYHNRASDVYFYINGGQLRNSLHRGISSLGLSTNAKYHSRIIEIGGEYKYDLQPKKIWHISPFVNFQASHLKQNAYSEHGAGIYNQHVESNSNTYFAAQAGFDFKRYYRTGMFGFRLGVKHGFTGADPDLRVRYEGDNSSSYRLRHKRDKTHFVFSLRGENEFARGWFLGGEAELQVGRNDKDVTASIMLRRMW